MTSVKSMATTVKSVKSMATTVKSVKSMATTVKSITTTTAEPPLSQSCCEQYMFLLELYICKIKSERLAKLNEMFCRPTTVEFSFLKYKPDNNLRITPVNPMFEPLSGIGEDDEDVELFYAGKSVLFALDNCAVANACTDFIIKLDAYKRFPKDIKPDVLVGKAEVDMTLLFAALRKEIIDNTKYGGNADIPSPSKTFDGKAHMCYCGEACGTIDVYARISGYGQTVVTEFGAPRVDASISSFLFKADDCENQVPKYKCRIIEPDCCDLSESSSTKDCMVCKPPKLPCSPCRVGSGAIVAKGKKDPCQKKEPKPAKADVCAKTTCSPIQTSRGPKEPCGKAVVLKVSGLLNNACADDPCAKPPEPRVTVASESEALRPDDLNKDPDHDVFILRIGKKGLVGADEKSDIQLEMRTPKGPERRPPIRLETREMQTEEDKKKKGGDKGKKKK